MSQEIQRRYRESHREQLREKGRDYRQNNREQIKERARISYAADPSKQRRASLKYRSKNRRKDLDYQNRYRKSRRLIDLNFRLRDNLRRRIQVALSGRCKSRTTIQLLGCSVEDLWIYLESKFQEGMTRENYGKIWHVDHIMPCAIFDLSRAEHQKRCFHFSNLQPLFGKENRQKSDKVLSNQFPLI